MDKKLDNLRHSAAHLLAAAVQELWPDSKRTIGPAIDNGFYFDFDFGDVKVTDADLPRIENKMSEILPTWDKFEGREVTADEARGEFKNNQYKIELIEEFVTDGQQLTFYKSGNYVDLCRGGHVENPREELKHFKLLSLAGAYWRGNEKNKMLTRIYGTAFSSQKELEDYLSRLDEAKKRDHKKLGKELDLFTFSELVGGGLPLWTPKGTLLRNLLDEYVWELRKSKGYQKVTIPHITKKELYQTSGHWEKFANDLFKIETREGHIFAMKPMNCPHHTQIYNYKVRSYKELPQRYAETTMVYRDEQTGELSGLSRVRCITQDDAHVFCRESHLKDEFYAIWDIIENFYKSCGFPELEIRLSLHDPSHPEKYLGSKDQWQKAEDQLRKFIEDKNVDFYEAPGEAAFYGPKIDFMANDSLGREWQVATIQADRNMPNNFDLYCINEQGEQERIIMIHAAIMGSIERFVSILIEHHAGAFPLWLSPVQANVLPITDKHLDYAKEVVEKLKNLDVRVELNDKNEPLNARIRDGQLQKVPYLLVVGDKETETNSVAVRRYGSKDTKVMGIIEFIDSVSVEINTKSSTPNTTSG